jgi:hypothetical protein
MRVLLLNANAQLYLQSLDRWTDEPEKALDFGSSLKAAQFAQNHCLSGLEVFLDFGDHEYNVYLPVLERLRYP